MSAHSAVEALRDMGYEVLEAGDAMDGVRLIVDAAPHRSAVHRCRPAGRRKWARPRRCGTVGATGPARAVHHRLYAQRDPAQWSAGSRRAFHCKAVQSDLPRRQGAGGAGHASGHARGPRSVVPLLPERQVILVCQKPVRSSMASPSGPTYSARASAPQRVAAAGRCDPRGRRAYPGHAPAQWRDGPCRPPIRRSAPTASSIAPRRDADRGITGSSESGHWRSVEFRERRRCDPAASRPRCTHPGSAGLRAAGGLWAAARRSPPRLPLTRPHVKATSRALPLLRTSRDIGCPGGGIGRRAGFRYLWPQGRGSSSLLLGTKLQANWRHAPSSCPTAPSTCTGTTCRRALRSAPWSRSTPRPWGSTRIATGSAWCSFPPATAMRIWCSSIPPSLGGRGYRLPEPQRGCWPTRAS